MKITTKENSTIQLTEVFNEIELLTNDGETMTICMRDSGFEFMYQGNKYSAQKGLIEQVKPLL